MICCTDGSCSGTSGSVGITLEALREQAQWSLVTEVVQEWEPPTGLVISLWSWSKNGTSKTEEHPRDSKVPIGQIDMELVTSRHWAKSLCPNCGNGGDLGADGDPKMVSNAYQVMTKGRMILI